jgi:HEAT repeat protein
MRLLLTLLAGIVIGLNGQVAAEDSAPIQPDFLMQREPAIEVSRVQMFLNPRMLTLWKSAFSHPESELHRQAALAVARAHEQKLPDLQQFRPDLLKLLKDDQEHRATRYAAAQALIILEARDSAADLFEASRKYGQDFRLLIEPVLGRWEFMPVRDVWAQRLKSTETPRSDLNLALNGVRLAQMSSVLPDLLSILKDSQFPIDLRLNAARSAAALAAEGLEPDAQQLLARNPAKRIDRLTAATLLSRHRSPAAVKLLQALAVDTEPAVAAEALRALYQGAPDSVLPVAEQALPSRAAEVRRVGIQTYLQLVTVERLRTLAGHLNDPHPDLRAVVREGLYTHSQDPQFESVVREAAIAVLASDDWRGQEQACLLLAALDRKEVAPRLVELLYSDRDEVMIASAWALRTLAVPETAPAMVARLRELSEPISNEDWGVSHQIAHLSEAIAVLKYRPALDVLRIYIPKNLQYHEIARSGAIYAIGVLFEDAAKAAPAEPAPGGGGLDKAAELADAALASQLADQLMGRVREATGMPPEFPEVRRTSAIAIGRMGYQSHIPGFKEMLGSEVSTDPVELAMRWSIHRMTGELLPIAEAKPQEATGWFLEPIPSPTHADSSGK